MALDLPETAVQAVPVVDVGGPWRPVPRESLHVTLAFLGSVDDVVVASLAAPLHAATGPVDALVFERVIGLPPRRPRVMAVALGDPSGQAAALQARISAAMAAAGVYEPERRPWLAHLTIARARDRAGAPRDAPLPSVERTAFAPPSVTLYRSLLHPKGARYEALERVPLR